MRDFRNDPRFTSKGDIVGKPLSSACNQLSSREKEAQTLLDQKVSQQCQRCG